MPYSAACTSCNHAIFGSHQSILTEKDNYGVGPSVDFCDFQRKTVFVMSSHCVTIFRIFQRQKSYLFWSGIIEPRFVKIQILVPDLQSPKESSKFYYKGLSATVPFRKSKITYCVCMSTKCFAIAFLFFDFLFYLPVVGSRRTNKTFSTNVLRFVT